MMWYFKLFICSCFLVYLTHGQLPLNLDVNLNQQRQFAYDFIIVGAGSAGCVIASRLSQNRAWTVLLLEAGGEEIPLLHDIPGLCHSIQRTSADWQYKTEPSNEYCTAMNNNQCNWPRGKVMGGSSTINYMIYNRGHQKDYDSWEAMGNTGWNYSSVLPYFKKLETTVVSDVPIDLNYRGTNGPVTVTDEYETSELAKAFVQGCKEQGFPHIDYNGKNEVGAARLQSNQKGGLRQSSNTAYIKPILNKRKNLTVVKYALVTKLIINPTTKTVLGVTFEQYGTTYTVMAKKEVIVSAGAINSPQLLMLSGIGPAAHLNSFGIPLIADLPVGQNLQDHVLCGLINVFSTAQASNLLYTGLVSVLTLPNYILNGTGPLSVPGSCEGILFSETLKPNDLEGWPDIEVLVVLGIVTSHPSLAPNFNLKRRVVQKMYSGLDVNHHFMMFPISLRPKSTGEIKLKSTDPHDYPAIDPKYFSNAEDEETMLRGIKLIKRIIGSLAMQKIKAAMVNRTIPGCERFVFDTDDYWRCHTRAAPLTMYHYAGTCKMGPKGDPTAVVDPQLRVHGVNKLRVCDASVMPNVVASE